MFKSKVIGLAVASLIIAPSAFANTSYYAGLDISGGDYRVKGSDSSGYDDDMMLQSAVDDLDSKVGFRLIGGKYLSDNVRVYGFLQRDGDTDVTNTTDDYTTKDTLKSYELGAGADYLHFFTNNFFASAGGSLGYYKSKMNSKLDVEVEDYSLNLNQQSKNSGLVTSLNIGLGYNFTDNFGLEGGYRYSYYSGNEHKFSFDDEGETWNEKVSFKSANQIYLNASYKF
ncbi:MAG: outer membrane beta-barrel protein [Vibrio toranzoniae]|uniref:outer membrane beta-barrel protein n=1 Tax=Vibrio toranzoniae TaxID=1194427 RepID=UPI003F9966E7